MSQAVTAADAAAAGVQGAAHGVSRQTAELAAEVEAFVGAVQAA